MQCIRIGRFMLQLWPHTHSQWGPTHAALHGYRNISIFLKCLFDKHDFNLRLFLQVGGRCVP